MILPCVVYVVWVDFRGLSRTRLWHCLGQSDVFGLGGIDFSAALRSSCALLYNSLSSVLMSSLMVSTVFIKLIM